MIWDMVNGHVGHHKCHHRYSTFFLYRFQDAVAAVSYLSKVDLAVFLLN